MVKYWTKKLLILTMSLKQTQKKSPTSEHSSNSLTFKRSSAGYCCSKTLHKDMYLLFKQKLKIDKASLTRRQGRRI